MRKMSKTPSLDQVNKENPHLVDHGYTELNFPKCKHELELVNSHEARCTKCTAGYTGPRIQELVQESKL